MKTTMKACLFLTFAGFATPALGASYSHCISAAAGDGHVEVRNNCVRDVHYLYCVVNPDAFSTEYDCDGGGGSGRLASGETAALQVGSTDARKIEFRWFACADGKIAEKAEWDSTGDYGVCRSPGESAEAPGSTRDDRRALQSALETEGFSPGPADGIFGPGTRAAIMAWQQSIGQAATGELTEEQIRLLLPRREWPQAAVAESGPGGVWESTPEDLWGSIAFSREPDRVLWAIVWNAGGQEPARQDAVEACQEVGGSDCSEIGWFRNACGALAVDLTGVGGYGTGWGGDTGEAEAMAMSECESAGNTNCQIEASRCTDSGSEIAGIDEPGEALAPTASETEAPTIAALSPMCPSGDGLCWLELDDQPGCYIYSVKQSIESFEVLTSSGECRGGKFTGSITGGDDSYGIRRIDFSVVDGQLNGRYLLQHAYDHEDIHITEEIEAVFLHGKQHGHYRWSKIGSDGWMRIEEGPYVDSLRHGPWSVKFTPAPNVFECHYNTYQYGHIIDQEISNC